MADPSALSDGLSTGTIAGAIVAVGSAIAWAVKAGLNRVAASFDQMIGAVDSNTASQYKTVERITAMEATVDEGCEDIKEVKELVQKLDRGLRPGRRAQPIRPGVERTCLGGIRRDVTPELRLPRHIAIAIEHQPHAALSESIEQWLERSKERDLVIVSDFERGEMLRTGQVWFVQWYPDTAKVFKTVAAATLQRALALANAPSETPASRRMRS
jgi:hypothetical protein